MATTSTTRFTYGETLGSKALPGLTVLVDEVLGDD